VSDDNLLAAPFANLDVTAGSASIVAPVVTVTAPIIIVAIVVTSLADSVSIKAVRSGAEVQLSSDFGFGGSSISSISGGCGESPRCARDGGDKWQSSHSDLLVPLTLRSEVNRKTARLFVR
jgi:hypothetical protein